MSRYLITLLWLVNLIRTALFPFVKFILAPLSGAISERLLFEAKNLPATFKNKKSLPIADLAFEVSSQGELEQIRPILDFFLKAGRIVELIFFSASVEKDCQALAMANPLLRIYRFPALSYSLLPFWGGQKLSDLISAKTLILCRYDFFPELLLIGAQKEIKFVLFAATIKNKENFLLSKKWSALKWFYENIFRSFYLMVTLTEADKNYFQTLNKKCHIYIGDFRIMRILERIENLDKKLSAFLFYKPWKDFLPNYNRPERLLMGSCYLEDLFLLDSSFVMAAIKERKLLIMLAPHKLSPDNVASIRQKLDSIFAKHHTTLPIYELPRNLQEQEYAKIFADISKAPGIVINLIPGILCEMYSYFEMAYVGGGFNRSIHSLLEPYWMTPYIYCGPKTFASKEYDFIKQYSESYVKVVEHSEEFLNSLQTILAKQLNSEFKLKAEMGHRWEIGNKMNDVAGEVINHILKERDAI
ncbi:MAG: hypothetical protein A2504_17710 [Bdellovibrionales bacterium RIFOXYD12_FULL_39_22]|nr:MAG: hypothetical protein A2385_15410 [Bdellovibrionales bacterium RIFOXYB1_FULL_39_21]OFZ40604.1 MAG: hypothetical protein A2485_03355 [Bdellovibrionales bacterium RIFOXYC12_FULL_39_17]OFZ50448.1 MAG: hypothetical protein A2404_02710 [Bdellovibrionales bacterium RIFOXYC1_FULL_39_130]OFZ68113.1 MAG: hypothetical protein A2451_00005 [Bdellovibrionales bacterium RIFOXYC2_FULL_39_8]OFZ77707.1 MAG: hypothetical protein A2560_05080 [Bdellovibrionales bacterium RIFOXYD1_FULL_39_84]OFZ91741.1 MAG: